MSMFKFGKYIRPKGPYDQYREPVSQVRSSRNTIVKANPGFSGGGVGGDAGFGGFGGGAGGSGFGGPVGPGNGGQGFNSDRYNPVFDQLEEGTVLEDWIPKDAAGLDMLFRRIYLRDPTIGPGVDIIKNLPWSDYALAGIKDKSILKIYEDSMDALQLPLLMPEVTGDHLVIGRNILSVMFNERKGIFSGVIPHDPDFIKITPVPIYGHDPLCDFKLSPGFKAFLMSTDPRAQDAAKALPPAFAQAARENQDFIPLDPVATIYLGRKASQHDHIGTSLLTRTLYFWAIEKALLNAQMTSTRRRSRSFVHLMAGIDNVWEPTPEELDALAGMVIQANEDPVGGVVATRTGVTIQEPVGGGQDFYKWSDELDLFAKYKMQAIGISEAMLSGDATYNNAEQARSVFVENLATLRMRIVTKMFYQNLFPTLARLHGFQKRTKAELDHNIRVGTTSAYAPKLPVWAQQYQQNQGRLTVRKAMSIPMSELIMPTIDWAKQLKPNQDEKYLEILERIKNNEFPVTLKQWAAAAGINTETLENDVVEDKKLRSRLENIEVPATDNADDAGGGNSTPDNAGDSGSDDSGGDDLGIPTEDNPNPDGGGDEAPSEEPSGDSDSAPDVPPEVIVPEGADGDAVEQALKALARVKPQTLKQMKGIY